VRVPVRPPALEAALAVFDQIPTDPRGAGEAARRDARVRDALADFTGPWLRRGEAGAPRELRFDEGGLGFWHPGDDRPAWRHDFDEVIPPPEGRLRVLDLQGLEFMRRATLSGDGRRIDFDFGEWWSRPPGWRPE
jgi:hypothetical protein